MIIGARVNRWWQPFRIFRHLGGRRGMNHVLQYLLEHPEKGLLGYESMGIVNVRYWRSFEHLEAFARDQDDPHARAWRNYWKRVGADDRTGIWHETFLVRDGEYEAVDGNTSSRARTRIRSGAGADRHGHRRSCLGSPAPGRAPERAVGDEP